jgi:hypothetical protein
MIIDVDRPLAEDAFDQDGQLMPTFDDWKQCDGEEGKELKTEVRVVKGLSQATHSPQQADNYPAKEERPREDVFGAVHCQRPNDEKRKLSEISVPLAVCIKKRNPQRGSMWQRVQ